MNFRLLLSCVLIACFAAKGMQQALSDKVSLVRQEVQRNQSPALEKLIFSYLSLDPLAQEMSRADFIHIREICINPDYVPILTVMVKADHEKKIVDPNGYYSSDDKTYHLLGEAVYSRAHENAKVLLDAGANPNRKAYIWDYGQLEFDCSYFYHVPLVTAVGNIDLTMIKVLLDGKINIPKNDISFALMRAVEICPRQARDMPTQLFMILKLLIQRGAEHNAKLHYATASNIAQKNYLTPRELAQKKQLTEVLALFDAKP